MCEEAFEEYKKLPKWKGKIFMKDEETCYKDGVECGYNKAKEEDKWHYVKDGDLPKENEYIMIYSKLADNIAVGKRRCAGKIRKRCVYEWYFATYEGTYCLRDKDIIAWKEIAKASPNFGKRVGYKMCVVDELHDMKELEAQNKWLEGCKSELAEHLGKANDRIAELEKGNKELKEKLKPENCLKRLLKQGYIKATCENSSELTKAKELLKDITSSYGSTEVSEAQLYLKIKRAEQFLKKNKYLW